MIKKIRLKNFYSFADAEIDLDAGASILVGINGSGKSNLLRAIRLLKEGVAGMGLRKYLIDELGGFDNVFSKANALPRIERSIQLSFQFDYTKLIEFSDAFDEDVLYNIVIQQTQSTSNYYIYESITDLGGELFLDFVNGEGRLMAWNKTWPNGEIIDSQRLSEPTDLVLSKIFDESRFPWQNVLRKAISSIEIYDYFDTTQQSAIRKPMLPTSEKRLLPNGSNLPQILNTIKINSKSSYNVIVSKLAEVNPNFKGIDFNFLGGNIELMLEEENFNSAIHVSSISDGTLRYLCLLSILYNPNRGSFICIDEPEVGLHPDMITTLGNCIVEASDHASFLISTHSENLLNCFELEQIRVVEKDATNSSFVSEYTKEDFKGWYKHFSAGTMWRTGDLGGNRW